MNFLGSVKSNSWNALLFVIWILKAGWVDRGKTAIFLQIYETKENKFKHVFYTKLNTHD